MDQEFIIFLKIELQKVFILVILYLDLLKGVKLVVTLKSLCLVMDWNELFQGSVGAKIEGQTVIKRIEMNTVLFGIT